MENIEFDNYQKACISNLADSGTLSTLINILDRKFFEKAKIMLDKPEELRDTISMSKVLREVEREFNNVINELKIQDDE